MAKQFTPRLTAPAQSNKYYIHKSKGGLGETIIIDKKTGSVLANCVGFAWSRAYESWGVRPKLSRGNAEDWWGYKDGYKRGQTPRLGAIICWRKGKVGYSADGAGHVAFVEKINKDGTIVVSNSNYSGTRFFTKTLTPKDKYHIGTGLTFQGFIYPPVELVAAPPKSSLKMTNADYPVKVKKGNYFTIRGTITSALKMSKVRVMILDKKGGIKFQYTAAPNAKTFDVHKADAAMMFRKLAKGEYTYKVMAWDANGSHTVMAKAFKVV